MSADAQLPSRRTLSYLKWLIFAVALPLIPVAALALRTYVGGNAEPITFGGLFGNGDLLILATVIGAAAIGDLLFDIRQRAVQWGLHAAMAASLTLLVMLASILTYGFVFHMQEATGSADPSAFAHARELGDAAENSYKQALNASAQVSQLAQELGSATASRTPDAATTAQNLQRQISDLTATQDRAAADASSAQHNASSILAVAESSHDVAAAHRSWASVIAFLSSIAAGAWCMWIGTGNDSEAASATLFRPAAAG